MKLHQFFPCFALLILSTLTASGCGGGSGDSSPGFVGTWDMRVNFAADDCQLVTPGIIAFADEHFISESEGIYLLEATSGFGTDAVGEVVEGLLSMNSTIDADIFGDGSLCEQTVDVGYSDLTEDDATVTFRFAITCPDGFFCSSEGVGQAERR